MNRKTRMTSKCKVFIIAKENHIKTLFNTHGVDKSLNTHTHTHEEKKCWQGCEIARTFIY